MLSAKQLSRSASTCEQVFFPAEASEQPLPRWFFDRSPSEVKAAFLARWKKNEVDQVCCHGIIILPRQCTATAEAWGQALISLKIYV